MKTYKKLGALLVLFSFGLMTAWADAEGKCGDNVSWKYRTSDKTLVLSGTGATSSGGQWSGTSYWVDPLLAPTRWSDSIEYVVVEDGITQLGDELFLGLTLAKKVSLPETLTAIGSSVFKGCYSMAEIIIPASVKEIGPFAFSECKSLKAIILPEALKKIDGSAFMDCANLQTLTVEEGNANYDSREGCNAIIETATNTLLAGSLKTVIPATVESIGYGAFSSRRIVSIEIPSSVKSIGPYAFSFCPNLNCIYVKWKTPISIITTVFYTTPLKTLVVPEGCIEAYKAADVWKNFEQIVTATDIKGGTLINDDSIKEIYRLDGTKVSGEQESLVPGTYIVQGEKILIK